MSYKIKSTPRYIALKRELAKLVSTSACVLVGSAALAARGIRDVNDLDVIVDSTTLEALRPKATEALGTCLAFKTLAGTIQISDRIEDHAPGVRCDSRAMMMRADDFGSGRVISAADLRTLKKALGRDKDLEDLRLMDEWDASLLE